MLENPAITRSELDGGGNDSKIVAICFQCGLGICEGETYYALGAINYCNNPKCKYEIFECNKPDCFKMANDLEILGDAVMWYFDEFTKEEGNE